MPRKRVSDREFESALERGRSGDVDLASASLLFHGADRRARRQRLFEAAARVRDERLGRRLTLSAHVHMVTRCELSASCKYCSLSSTIPTVSDERSPLTLRETLRGVRFALEHGVGSIVLVGGTDLGGSDTQVRTLVARIREETDVPLGLDVGPSLSAATLRWLGERSVDPIYCSMETIDPAVFANAKPGDDLAARLRFMRRVERSGSHLGNIVMNGLGGPESLLRTVLASREFPRTSHLHISTFHRCPAPHGPGDERPRCGPRSRRSRSLGWRSRPSSWASPKSAWRTLGTSRASLRSSGPGAATRSRRCSSTSICESTTGTGFGPMPLRRGSKSVNPPVLTSSADLPDRNPVGPRDRPTAAPSRSELPMAVVISPRGLPRPGGFVQRIGGWTRRSDPPGSVPSQ